MYQYLPNVLVGMSFFKIHSNTLIKVKQQLDLSPEWTSRPYNPTNDVYLTPSGFPRIQTSVNLESNSEAVSETSRDYNNKSMMSLDGIFSPISFYPTPYSSTFSISKYLTTNCPFCFGTKTYTYTLLNDDLQTSVIGAGIQGLSDATSTYTRNCPFCESRSAKLDNLKTSVSPGETMPPYIIASGDDLTIISKLPMSGVSGSPIINYSTLNPIVFSSGEFSNFQNKQSGDLTGHCIDLISIGFTLPKAPDGIRPAFSKNINKSYLDYDANLLDWNQDLSNKGITVPNIPSLPNNARFFGLRGPIMVHGWGYDTEGFPVPNSSGEPLMENGNIKRDSDNNILGKNQKWVAGVGDGGGYWTKPYKENTFYKAWAQQPGSWPVGPIDLRWDENARVWTVGANYKPVYVVIEEDLLGTAPVRGELIDSSYDNTPLPNDLRRLVFVKDAIGMYPAPRGAALYCKYNSINGFYEPIGHRPFITSGVIQSANSVQIYKIYTKPNDPNIRLSDDPSLETYISLYKNPLNFAASVGNIGLFTFLDGHWTLSSFNC